MSVSLDLLRNWRGRWWLRKSGVRRSQLSTPDFFHVLAPATRLRGFVDLDNTTYVAFSIVQFNNYLHIYIFIPYLRIQI